MDPENLPADERSRSARDFPCPYCGVDAGTRCRTVSGDYYTEWSYVHIDRLITMYRDAFVNRSEREGESWRTGYLYGLERGWEDGVRDTRYTFENTPVYLGCREADSLNGSMEAAKVSPASSDEAISKDEPEAPSLHAVPKNS